MNGGAKNLFLMGSKSWDPAQAEAAKEILLKNYSHKITIRYIASKIGVSEKTLQRAFKSTFKKGIHEYLIIVRMEKAKVFLEDKKLIKQVAGLVGYKSHSSFTKRFSKHFGMRPSDFENS